MKENYPVEWIAENLEKVYCRSQLKTPGAIFSVTSTNLAYR